MSDWYVELKSFDQSCICFLFGTKVCISLHVCMPFEEILGVCVCVTFNKINLKNKQKEQLRLLELPLKISLSGEN